MRICNYLNKIFTYQKTENCLTNFFLKGPGKYFRPLGELAVAAAQIHCYSKKAIEYKGLGMALFLWNYL